MLIWTVRESTPAIRGGIASLERVNLGGSEQSILIRGAKLSNPVLLFLHGGPGMPTMYLAHAFQRPLEEHFIAVQWDRLGAGKSFRKDIPPAKIRVSREVADTVELIELLRKRFHKDKIYLAGFSYGSYLAMLVASRHHELLHAVIGIGQQACSPKQERQLQEAWIREHAVAAHAEEAIRQLDGKEPLDREKWLFEFGGELHHSKSWVGLLATGLMAPEYRLADALNVQRGLSFTHRNLKYDVIQGALMDEVTSVRVPVYFFMGRFDFTAPTPCAEEYFRRLQAPSKELVWFEDSAHFVFFEEPKRFAAEAARIAATLN